MGDGGLPLQAAAAGMFLKAGLRPRLTTMALGPSARSQIIRNLISALPAGVYAIRHAPHACVERLASALAVGEVVGLFRGRAEFGPRALCNRSLLCRPDLPGIGELLNRRLRRSDFMPFAPVVSERFAPLCFVGWLPDDHSSRYMTRTYFCTPAMKQNAPAVVHVDGTARPQVIRESEDSFMHQVLQKMHAGSGVMSLINTSFNIHESPIIGNLQLAVEALSARVCDCLFVDDAFELRRTAEAG
jgi:carbamoyltransferase